MKLLSETLTDPNKILLDHELCQMVERDICFGNHLSPCRQGSDVDISNVPYTDTCPERSNAHAQTESNTCCVSPCSFIGVSLDCLSMLITGYYAWLRVKPPFILKLLECSWISLASFTVQFMYSITFPSIKMLL